MIKRLQWLQCTDLSLVILEKIQCTMGLLFIDKSKGIVLCIPKVKEMFYSRTLYSIEDEGK